MTNPDQRASIKTAVVLFVKDEAHDILTWLTWHKLVGFDSFIICDDGSTDGTPSLIEVAAKHFDIRFSEREFAGIDYFYFRQEAFYKRTLEIYKDEFDWIAFFDADEYLSINDGISLPAMLSEFPNADAIAINWASYGSNGNVLSPAIPSVAAFTRHGKRDDAICTHVKSIVRPGKVGANWLNVHAFDVGCYRNSDNQPFHWGHIPGVTKEAPTWNRAKLMHFQLRSMEQFVERCKRRPDVRADRKLFDGLDHNDLEDLRPLQRLPEITRYFRNIVRDLAVLPLREGSREAMFEGDWAAFRLFAWHGDIVGAAPHGLTAAENAQGEVFAIFSAAERKCILFADGPQTFYSTYHATYAPISREIILQDVANLKYLTALPKVHGGGLEATREIASLWEKFVLGSAHPLLNGGVIDVVNSFNKYEASVRITKLYKQKHCTKNGEMLAEIALELFNQNDLVLLAEMLDRRGGAPTQQPVNAALHDVAESDEAAGS